MSSTMNDEEIRENLLRLGANVGPVVDSTREFYRRKLAKLLGEIKDEPLALDDEGSVSDTEETGENIEQWRDNLFSETYNPPGEIRARRSIHTNLDRSPGYFSSNTYESSAINRRSNVSTDTSGTDSTVVGTRNTKLLSIMFGLVLLFLILYFYKPSTEVALKEN